MLKAHARVAFPVAIPATQPMGAGILDAKAALAHRCCRRAQRPGLRKRARPLSQQDAGKNLAGAAGAQLSYVHRRAGRRERAELHDLRRHRRRDVARALRAGADGRRRADLVVRASRATTRPIARRRSTRGGQYYVKVVGAQAFAARDAGSAPQLIARGASVGTAQDAPPTDVARPAGSSYPRVPPGVAFVWWNFFRRCRVASTSGPRCSREQQLVHAAVSRQRTSFPTTSRTRPTGA